MAAFLFPKTNNHYIIAAAQVLLSYCLFRNHVDYTCPGLMTSDLRVNLERKSGKHVHTISVLHY